MRLLPRFRHYVAARHLEELALEARIWVHHHHVGALLDAFMPHPPLCDRIESDVKAAEFHQRGALAGAEFDAAVGNEIERGDTLRDPRRVVVFRRHQADAVTETDVFGALRARCEEYLGRRGVRIFLEKMMLGFPGVVDAEFVGEFDLIERFLEQPALVAIVPRPRKLMLVKNAEFHGRFSLLFEHDLRANAPRLSRGKTGTHPSGRARGHAFPDHAPNLFLAKLSSLAGRVASVF